MKSIYKPKKRMVYPEKVDQERKASSLSSSAWSNDPVVEIGENSRNKLDENYQGINIGTNSTVDLQFVQQRIRNIIAAMTSRTQDVLDRFERSESPPPLFTSSSTSNSLSSSSSAITETPTPNKNSTPGSITDLEENEETVPFDHQVSSPNRINSWSTLKLYVTCKVIHPHATGYVTWMCIVTLSVLYNVWVIPLRSSFPYQCPENRTAWMFFDYLVDLIYLMDMTLIQPRIMYISDGFWVSDINLTKKNYLKKIDFKLDLISLIPFDFLYLLFGPEMVILRSIRFVKINTFWKSVELIDKIIHSPHIIRISKILMYMMYLIHINACAYYAFSIWRGIGSNDFVYDGRGNAYITCFYFATKTATSIGKNPKPTEEAEYVFMTFSWLMGVFVFALLIGQIRDIIATATRQRSDFKKLEDETLEYMRRQNLPHEMLRRVQLWFNYTWITQRTLDELTIVDCLPHKMKTDIAKNVHFKTLSKVSLFKDCDEGLLHELVLQLKPMIYLPGDVICKRGDVGNEMYIVKSGQVQVVGGSSNEILATLSEGCVFGEISLLGIKGMNRRTADVKSRGFSNLFVLSKIDLNNALRHYPEAQELLNRRAKQLMRQNAALEKKRRNNKTNVDKDKENSSMIIIGNSSNPSDHDPKLIKTVLQVVPRDSKTHRLLRYGSAIGPSKSRNDRFKVRYSLPTSDVATTIKNTNYNL